MTSCCLRFAFHGKLHLACGGLERVQSSTDWLLLTPCTTYRTAGLATTCTLMADPTEGNWEGDDGVYGKDEADTAPQRAVGRRPIKKKGSVSDAPALGKVPAFVAAMWLILNDERNRDAIRWTEDGLGFVIVSEERLRTQVLPAYFAHDKLASWGRQLNFYNFKRVPGSAIAAAAAAAAAPPSAAVLSGSVPIRNKTLKDAGGYRHKFFQRGHPEMLDKVGPRTIRRGSKPGWRAFGYTRSSQGLALHNRTFSYNPSHFPPTDPAQNEPPRADEHRGGEDGGGRSGGRRGRRLRQDGLHLPARCARWRGGGRRR